MNKKGVSQIVTTILIILLVLAAIVIVWQAVKGTVETGSQTITSQSKCIGLDLSIAGTCTIAGTALPVTITRGGDSVGAGTLKITAASTSTATASDQTTTGFSALDTATKTLTLQAGGMPWSAGASVTVNTGLILNPGTTNEVMCAGAKKVLTCATGAPPP